jgi:steroid delta-isomerase-like uncharacterized protein
MDNKEVVRRVMDGVWNQGNAKVAEECIAADCRTHDPSVPNAQPGPGVLVEQMKTYRGAFPDMKMTIDQQFAEGDCVITRWTCRGTHTGSLAGVPASQRKVTVTGIQIDKFRGDKIVESWANWDLAGLMQQIGVMPPIGTTTGTSASRGAAIHK